MQQQQQHYPSLLWVFVFLSMNYRHLFWKQKRLLVFCKGRQKHKNAMDPGKDDKSLPDYCFSKSIPDKWSFTYLGGMVRGERGFGLPSSFFSLMSRGGRILGLSFSSRFIRSLSHSSFRRILSFSRSLSLSLSLCRRSLSRWSLSRSLSRCRSRGSWSRSCWGVAVTLSRAAICSY